MIALNLYHFRFSLVTKSHIKQWLTEKHVPMSVTPTRPVSLSLTKPPSTAVTSKKLAEESLEEKQISSILENAELPILLVWENKTMNALQVS